MKRLLLLSACALSGCSFTLGSFEECTQDSDCVSRGAGLVCKESLCVTGAAPDPMEAKCARTVGDDAAEVVFGAMLPYTSTDGQDDPRGQARENAIKLAVDEMNEREGINGRRRMKVVLCDTSGDADLSKQEATFLIEKKGVPAILSPGSRETLAAASVTVPKGVLLVSGSATSPELTTLNDNGLVWRTAPSDAIQGKVIGALLKTEGYGNKLAVIAVDDPYGQGLSDVFKKAYAQSVGSFIYAKGTDGKSALDQAEAFDPDMTLFIGFPTEATTMLNDVAANRTNLKQSKWFFTDSTKQATVFSGVSPNAFLEEARGTASATPAPSSPAASAYESFRSRYQSKFNLDPNAYSFTANTYDATYLLSLAASFATTSAGDQPITGTRMAEGLKHVAVAGATERSLEPLGYSAVRQDLESGKDVNVLGASGLLDFDPATGEAPSDIEIWKFTAAGGIQHVETRQP